MAIYKIRCRLNFHNMRNDLLDVFAIGVRDGIYNNVIVFAMPPLAQPMFQALIDAYLNTYGAYKQGGLAQKGPFLAAKTALINGLDQFAEYVNPIANNDANIVTLAGFVPTKGSSSTVNPPGQPTGIVVKRGISGELLAECPKITTVIFYGALLIADNPLPDNIMINEAGQIIVDGTDNPSPSPSPSPGSSYYVLDMNKSRKKKFTGLTKGRMYYIYFYAANAGGVSPLSEGTGLDPL